MYDLIFIGDSITSGFGVSKEKSFFRLIVDRFPNLNLLNKGVNGDTSTGILSRFYSHVTSKSPKAIFIMCGTNDLLLKRSPESIFENLELMIKESLNSKIIIAVPPTIIPKMANDLFSYSENYDYCFNKLPILREKILALKDTYNTIQVLDLYTLTTKNIDSNIFLDGIHLNEKGNHLLADFIAKSL